MFAFLYPSYNAISIDEGSAGAVIKAILCGFSSSLELSSCILSGIDHLDFAKFLGGLSQKSTIWTPDSTILLSFQIPRS